jgi:PAS domain S-box-containing protein
MTKILLVDDREDNLLSMETILERQGYEFVKANSGKQALQALLKETDFALILMDVAMPNLNGFDTASLIYEREKLRHIPIIFITGFNYTEENVFRGYRMGAVEYIFKPVNPDLLRAKVAVFVDLYRKNESIRQKNQELLELNIQLTHAREQLADDRTRFLVQAMPHIVATATVGEGLNYCNDHLMNFTGKSYVELHGWEWKQVLHPDDEPLITDAINKLLDHENVFRGIETQVEVRLRKADGSYIWHIALLKPFPITMQGDGNAVKWILTLTDIHDQKIMDEKKNEFIALASHELKTPLTSAIGYTELLDQIVNTSDEEVKLYIKKAHESMERLKDLINELLDINKIQQGLLQLNYSEFDIQEMISEAVEHIKNNYKKHQIVIKQEISNQLIFGDKNKLQQVCVNLLSNAVKYSPNAAEVEISVSSMNPSKNTKPNGLLNGNTAIAHEELLVGITDHGIGIARSDFDKIFNKFYRVHGMLDQQGLGIGLYLSAEIIKQHQGEIWVESELGKGSTFYFTVPQKELDKGEPSKENLLQAQSGH